ncbi:nicotinate-nucleotide adenylyltransferase [Marinimicrobium sp. LS-A18]|uniref:nicotinate-nucleotide adenylyltransferase n=1 Tax=Marinimicrobium sp. LS-A18 TaxID=1381596 RepID=UPI0004B06DA9|nr:nicotinate-nucleotide adenylyltransferase [Marinimicrobium sp. LS-A18]
MTQAIGLLGGTFDPIHLGHLRMALEAGETLALDEVRLLPCHQPPHRATPDVSSVERTEMLRLALADCPSLVLDDRELHRDGPSYTLDTLKSLRAELGPAVSLIWVLGCDAFLGLEQWHGWQELLDWGHLLVIARPGWELPSRGPLAEWLSEHQVAPEALTASPAGAIGVQALRLLPISATEIRSLIQAGRSPQFLLPDSVWQYIRDNNLYRARA